MKPPPEMVEVISLPKTCRWHVFATHRQRIVALAVKIGNANTKASTERSGLFSYYSNSFPKTCHWHVFASHRQRIVALAVKIGNVYTKASNEWLGLFLFSRDSMILFLKHATGMFLLRTGKG
jgi:hypothetical protein